MNQTGFRFPDNPNDPTIVRIRRGNTRGFAASVHRQLISAKLKSAMWQRAFRAIDHFFNRGEEERFSKGRAEVSVVKKYGQRKSERIENLQEWIFLFCS